MPCEPRSIVRTDREGDHPMSTTPRQHELLNDLLRQAGASQEQRAHFRARLKRADSQAKAVMFHRLSEFVAQMEA